VWNPTRFRDVGEEMYRGGVVEAGERLPKEKDLSQSAWEMEVV